MKNRIRYSEKFWVPIIILAVVTLLTVGSSPLFRTNPWDDSNAMLTMGRSMLHGVVPYRDVIDQRGPVLYAVFALGALFKETNFFGVFIVQCLNLLCTYIISYRIAKDMTSEMIAPQWAALFGPLALISTSAFGLSGAPEEFAFTSVLYLLYIINHYHRHVSTIPVTVYYFLGLNLSLVFWNKYSLIGAFCAFFIWVAIELLRQYDFRRLLRVVIASLAGFLTISLFVVVYFLYHHALNDLINIYFVQNLTSYGKTDQTILMQLWRLLLLVATEVGLHPFVSAFIIFGWLKAIYNRENMILEIVLFLSSLFFVAMQHWVIDYYNIVWLPFLAIALLRIASIRLPESLMRPTVQAQMPLLMTALLLILPMVNNRSALGRLVISNEETAIDGQSYVAQPQFATAMRKNTDSRQQPTMIMINSLDKGFYLSAQALPTTRFWHRLNMSYQQLPQMYDAFANTMRQKQVQFVIIKLNTPPENDATLLKQQINRAIDSHLQQPLFNNYRIDETARNGNNDSYVLMRLKNLE